jgi:uridine kinase
MRHGNFILGLTGGSGAGKTMLAARLQDRLAPLAVLVVAEDDYYRDNGALPDFDAGNFNFDDPAARDHLLLAGDLAALKLGKTIEAPRYDFARHRRLGLTRTIAPAPLIIVEGLHILCNEAMRAVLDLAAFLDVPDEVRFARRLQRDVYERGRDAASVQRQYEATVRPMHLLHTEPCRRHADLVLDQTDPDAPEEILVRLLSERLGIADGARSRHISAS